MRSKNKLWRNIFTIFSLLAVFGFGVLTIIGSGGSNGGGDNGPGVDTDGGGGTFLKTINIDFSYSPPSFFAWRNGLDQWQVSNVTQTLFTFDVTDPDGFFSFAAVCEKREGLRGVYMDTTAQELDSFKIECDESTEITDSTTYTIGGIIGETNGKVNSAKLAFGKTVESIAPGATGIFNYTFDVDVDNDKVKAGKTIGDFVIEVDNSSGLHYKIRRMLDVFTNPTAVDFDATANEFRNEFEVDVSNVMGDPGFQVSSKIDLYKTKFPLMPLSMGSFVPFPKLPPGERDPDDLYVTYIDREGILQVGNVDTATAQMVQVRSDPKNRPDNLKFDQFPNVLPDISISKSPETSFRLVLNASYDNGITGMNDIARMARADNGTVEWEVWQTAGRFSIGAIEFPIALEFLNPYDSTWTPSDLEVKSYSYILSNRDAATLNKYLFLDQGSGADFDGMDYGISQLNF